MSWQRLTTRFVERARQKVRGARVLMMRALRQEAPDFLDASTFVTPPTESGNDLQVTAGCNHPAAEATNSGGRAGGWDIQGHPLLRFPDRRGLSPPRDAGVVYRRHVHHPGFGSSRGWFDRATGQWRRFLQES
jgi:hypothetical protein